MEKDCKNAEKCWLMSVNGSTKILMLYPAFRIPCPLHEVVSQTTDVPLHFFRHLEKTVVPRNPSIHANGLEESACIGSPRALQHSSCNMACIIIRAQAEPHLLGKRCRQHNSYWFIGVCKLSRIDCIFGS